MLRLGILASQNATDMQAIIEAIGTGKLDAKIAILITNKKDSFALERAMRNDIKAVFLEPKGKSREEFDKEIADTLDEEKVDLILLIGYMRILSKWFVNRYKNKILNIHPSLLPAFGQGMDKDVHKKVLDYGCKITGCTLHIVDESVDNGPIVMQKAVEIDEKETVATLREKVQKAEQEIIVKAIMLFCRNKISIEGRKVIINGA